jgi:hypothetical protein
MSGVVNIDKIAEITAVQMRVEASKKDSFRGTLVQAGVLPFIFFYGESRTLKHTCAKCGLEVQADFGYGSKQLIGLGRLSRQGFNENRAQLDVIGKLFNQFLYHKVDSNGFESYLYQSDPDNNKGALLSVAYYRCAHCQAQYLVLYQNQLKEERPPFEPDEILIKSIYQVVFDHEELLRILNRPRIATASHE